MLQAKQKPKKPYILKLKHHKTQQSQQPESNNLYELLKKQSQNSRKFKTLEDDKEFYIKLDQIIQRQPAKVIGKQLGIVQAQKNLHKRRKSLIKASYQPKKSYQNYTQSLFNRLPKKRTKSHLPYEEQNRKQKNISKSSTGFVRTVTNQSILPQNITINLNQACKDNDNNRYILPNHQSLTRNKNISPKFNQEYNDAFIALIKETKSCSSQIIKQQKRLDQISQFHERVYKHFDKLAIRQKQMENIEFDDMSAITKVERYKFNTNNFLQNLLLKKDNAAMDWIDKENKKQFRKNTIEIVKQKLTDGIIQSKCNKYYKQTSKVPQQIENKQLCFTKLSLQDINKSQNIKYQKPKRIKDILYIKAKN